MKSQLWYNIKVLFFPKKKTPIFDISRGETKKKYFKHSFPGKFPSKNLFENKNDKNSFLFSETFSTNKINNDYFIRSPKNSHIGYFFSKLFFFLSLFTRQFRFWFLPMDAALQLPVAAAPAASSSVCICCCAGGAIRRTLLTCRQRRLQSLTGEVIAKAVAS